MTGHDSRWTTLDLELFHDEELPPDRLSKLSEDLRRDAALRARLADVRRNDDAMRTALLTPHQAEVRPSTPRLRSALVAASFLLVVGAAAWLMLSRPPGRLDPTDRPEVGPEYRSVRVVFSLPLPPKETQADSDAATVHASTPSEEQGVFLSRLERTLGAGRVEETLELMASAPTERRRAGYRYLGEVLRSAQVAEMILDRLSLNEQLAVCGEWASEPTMRPIVFARLRRLSNEPSLAGAVELVLIELSANPALHVWLRGYDLARPS